MFVEEVYDIPVKREKEKKKKRYFFSIYISSSFLVLNGSHGVFVRARARAKNLSLDSRRSEDLTGKPTDRFSEYYSNSCKFSDKDISGN